MPSRAAWGSRNTRVQSVKRVSCPRAIKVAYLNSCGLPDVYVGNNIVWGNARASYMPHSWCKTTKEECMASPLYMRSAKDYLASTHHALCNSATCRRHYQEARALR